MGMLEDLAAFLDSEGVGVYSPSGSEVRNIFIGSMPTSPDSVIVLHQYPRGSRDFFDDRSAGLHIEIRGAARDYSGPETLSESVALALHGIKNTDIGGHRYQVIQLLGEPEKIRVEDDTSRIVFGTNFRVKYS